MISLIPVQSNAMQFNSFAIDTTFEKRIVFTFSLNCVREVLCGSFCFCSGVFNASYIINQLPAFLGVTSKCQNCVLTLTCSYLTFSHTECVFILGREDLSAEL